MGELPASREEGSEEEYRSSGRVTRDPALQDPEILRRQAFEINPEAAAKLYGVVESTSRDGNKSEDGKTSQMPRKPRFAGELVPPVIVDPELKKAWDNVHGIIETTASNEEQI